MSENEDQKKKFVKILLLLLPSVLLILSGLGGVISVDNYSRNVGIGCLVVGGILFYTYKKIK